MPRMSVCDLPSSMQMDEPSMMGMMPMRTPSSTWRSTDPVAASVSTNKTSATMLREYVWFFMR